MSKLKAAILIVSTTASKDPSTDTCTSTLQSVFSSSGDSKWEVAASKIVPDDISDIRRAITLWADGSDGLNLIVTSGGTGFAVGDCTPEAVGSLLHKQAPGLVHTMLSASLAVTPCAYPNIIYKDALYVDTESLVAAMARPLAGVRHNTLILTLPGSPKGAKENLEAVIKLLPHACSQAAGEDSRRAHSGGVKKLEQDAGMSVNGASGSAAAGHSHHHHSGHEHGHGHGHGHGHAVPKAHTDPSSRPQQSNDPSLGPTRRYRTSPYPMLSVQDALQLISNQVPAPKVVQVPLTQDLIGHVLAEDVVANEAVPAFRASIVDGYSVVIPDKADSNGNKTKGTFPVAFATHAEAGNIPELKPGEIARITTGAPLPPNASAVVMVEDTVLKRMTDDGSEEAEVEILTDDIQPDENVREVGSDVKQGSTVMKSGEGISAIGGEFGLLASVGTRQVSVYKKPVVGVLSTGDEIVEHDARQEGLKLGEVRDTNRPTLLTAVKAQGFEVVDLGIASDKPGALESTLRSALVKTDVLITTGGVSMGELDLLKPTIERSLGGVIHFGRVSMKPGKPTTFATIPGSNIKDPASGSRGDVGSSDRVVFSLPGNPASAVVTFMLFVLPALHQMSGIKPVGLPRLNVRLDGDVRCDESREEYHRVVVFPKDGAGDEGLWASSTGGQRSSRIGSFKGANALLKLPAGGGTLAKGTKVEALMMSAIGVGSS